MMVPLLFRFVNEKLRTYKPFEINFCACFEFFHSFFLGEREERRFFIYEKTFSGH
jgi:hypothetical protein